MLTAYAQFERLHSGLYHDTRQAIVVSKLASSMASQAKFSRKDSRFLAQVALLHNADERRNLETGERNPLQAPQVHNTLDWLLSNRDSLCGHFCWTKTNFHMACALVARTCYPFDNEPRQLGENFHGQGPVEIVGHFLNLLAPEQREDALRLGLILRFADQIANCTENWKRASSTLAGLVRELAASGVKLKPGELNTRVFLENAGSDLTHDRALALRFGISREGLFGRQQLLDLLPAPVKRRFDANLAVLAKSAQAA